MKMLTLFFFVFTLSIANSQTDNNVEQNLFKVNIINPGFDYEFASGENFTTNLGISLQPFWQNGAFGLVPNFNFQYRLYNNLERRLEKNKRIAGNSGDYFGVSVSFFFEEPVLGNLDSGSNFFGFLGPIYGVQRTNMFGFNFSAEVGVGYYLEGDNYSFLNNGKFGPTISLSVGWVLGKNK